jgi:GntR family transcriptional regulator
VASDIRISTGSSVPIYRQIVDHVCAAVARGQAQEGEALPSVRALAEQLVINPNTVAKAYAELARQGVIEARQGKGVFIAKRRQIYSRAERIRRLEAAADALVHEGAFLDFQPDEMRQVLDKKLSDFQAARQENRKGRT